MSSRFVQLGLLSFISSAFAVPAYPNGDFASFYGAGNGAAMGQYGKGIGSDTMEAVPENTNVAAANGDGTSCITETHYATTTNMMTVYVTSGAAEAPVDSTIFPSPVAPSSAPAAAPAPSSAMAPQAAVSSAPAPVMAPSSTPAAPVAAASTVAPVKAVSSPASSPSSSPVSSSSGKKRGVAYNSASLAQPFIGKQEIGWAYNWVSDSAGLASGIEYTPLLWGSQSSFTGNWQNEATKAISNGATAILGFNEPDHSQQANLSPAAAATAYKQYITTPFSGKAKLVSPAVTNGGAPMGLTWLSSFMSACADCEVDAIAIHWYDSSSNVDYFKSYIQGANKQFGKPIWLTEFGTTDGNDDAFLKEVLPWLDSQSYVERYAYFMATDGKLNSGTGLSTAGNTYCAYTG